MHQTSYFYQYIPVNNSISDSLREQILNEFPPPTLPSGEENFSIDSVEKGTIVNVPLLLNEYSIEKTKTNKDYIKIRFSNNSGISIQAKMWDNQDSIKTILPLLDKYSIFLVGGKVEEYRGFKSLTLSKIEPCEDNINPFTFLPYTKQNLEDYTVELFSYLYELESPFKELTIASMHRFWNEFRIRPAAKGYHHNYLGGLLKHTVGLMRFARFITKQEENHFQAVMKLINVVEKAHKREIWSQLNEETANSQQLVWKDTIEHLYQMFYGMMQYKNDILNDNIIMTSILFHDMGKLLEYDHAGKKYDEFKFLFPTATYANIEKRKATGIIMDQLGVMIGHTPYGLLMLTKIIETENIQLSLEEIHQIAHCILCHHGLPEWGASVRSPQSIEGYIVHIVDYLDSRYELTEGVK